MKQKTKYGFMGRNSFWDRTAAPLFIIIMFAALLSSISEAAATSPFAYIANGSHNGVTVIDTSTNNPVTTITVGSDPEGVAVNTAGTYVYVANNGDNTVSVINTSTNSVAATIPVGGSPYGVAVNTAGTFVYVANVGGSSVSVIDTNAGSVVATIPVGEEPEGVAVNPAGTYVYVTNSADSPGTVSVINTSTNTVVATIPVGTNPFGVAVNHAGTYAYVTNVGDGTVSVINTTTNSVVTTVKVGSEPEGIAVNPAGTYVYVPNDGDGTLSIIDTSTNSVIATVTLGQGLFGISVTSDGHFVYIANEQDNKLSIIDTTTNSLSANVFISSGAVVFGSFLSTGTFSDVPSTSAYYNYIEAIYQAGITTGCGTGGDYECSSPDVTRDQMAAFIIRALYGGNFTCNGGVDCSTTAPYFLDVPGVTANQFFPYIQKLKEIGITTGCGAGGDYECASPYVTRDQMAAFLVRATQVKAGQGPETYTCNGGAPGASVNCATTSPYFLDVTPATDSFFPYIQKLKELGITTGCGTGGDYECPSDDNVTRDQMAAFLSRAFLGLK